MSAASGIDVRGEVAIVVAIRPDHALQRFKCCVLAVLVDPALQDFDDDVVVADAAVFGGDHVQPATHVGFATALAHERGECVPRVREQHVLDEGNAAGRAFDVGEDQGFHVWCQY